MKLKYEGLWLTFIKTMVFKFYIIAKFKLPCRCCKMYVSFCYFLNFCPRQQADNVSGASFSCFYGANNNQL